MAKRPVCLLDRESETFNPENRFYHESPNIATCGPVNGATPDPTFETAKAADEVCPDAAKVGTREVIIDEERRVETPYYDRRELRPGHKFTGPAIVELNNTTIWLPPPFGGRVDRYGNIIASRIEQQ